MSGMRGHASHPALPGSLLSPRAELKGGLPLGTLASRRAVLHHGSSRLQQLTTAKDAKVAKESLMGSPSRPWPPSRFNPFACRLERLPHPELDEVGMSGPQWDIETLGEEAAQLELVPLTESR